MRGPFNRMPAGSAMVSEIRATVAVAGPLAAANLAQMAMGFTNTVIVGSLGSAALAAAGLGTSLYFTVALVCSGILTAVAPLAAHAIGAGDNRRAGRVAGAGLVLAALLAVPVVAVLLVADRLLVVLGYEPALAAEIGRFLGAIAWAAPGFLGFAVLRSFLVAASHSRTVMIADPLHPDECRAELDTGVWPPRGAGSGHRRLRLRDRGDPMADVCRSRILCSYRAEP